MKKRNFANSENSGFLRIFSVLEVFPSEGEIAAEEAIGRPTTQPYGRERALPNLQNPKNRSILRMVCLFLLLTIDSIFDHQLNILLSIEQLRPAQLN